MTLGELLTLDAGRELDEAIAEHVMGWQAWKLNNGTVQLFSPSDAVWLPQFGKRTDEQHASCDTSCHKWSTDIAASTTPPAGGSPPAPSPWRNSNGAGCNLSTAIGWR